MSHQSTQHTAHCQHEAQLPCLLRTISGRQRHEARSEAAIYLAAVIYVASVNP